MEFVRGRRRAERPEIWIKEKDDKGIGFQNRELTKDNQDFLRELAVDR